MINRKIGLALALALVICLAACNRAPASPSPSPSATPAAAFQSPGENASPKPTAAWTDRVTEKSFKADDGTVILKATYVLPEMKNPDAAGLAINAYYDQQLTELFSYLEGDLHDAALSDYQSAADKSQFAPYEDDQEYTIPYKNGSVICFLRQYYNYSGGAHGNTALTADIFRLDSGKHLTIADFFTADAKTYKGRLLKIILADAAEKSDRLFEGYEATIPSVFDPNHFYLNGDGFVFYFQPYEIAPYAAGTIEFKVPYDSVKDIMAKWS